MNTVIFWDIGPYSSYVNRSFGGKRHLLPQGRKLAELETSLLQVARQSSALKMEIILTSETSVHIRTTLLCIPEG
jgi:hypothetical protein